MQIRDGITFDDLLLVPKYSDIKSRSDVDLSVDIKGVKYSYPIVPANMQSVVGIEMARSILNRKGLCILHRFMSIEEQISIIEELRYAFHKFSDYFVCSVGVKEESKEHVAKFAKLGIKIFCIDIAHGDSAHGVDMTQWIRKNYPDSTIISGNVATYSGSMKLWDNGADVVKSGIGNGSLCSTRIETGCGVPQVTALIESLRAKNDYENRTGRKVYLISDGGCRNPGDYVKALTMADMVMTGHIFAGCAETPGQVLSIMGKTYKEYRGSSTHKASHIEGVIAMVPTKGKFSDILHKLLEGISSGCSYQGAHNLIELKDNPEFIRITNSGLVESHPHDVQF